MCGTYDVWITISLSQVAAAGVIWEENCAAHAVFKRVWQPVEAVFTPAAVTLRERLTTRTLAGDRVTQVTPRFGASKVAVAPWGQDKVTIQNVKRYYSPSRHQTILPANTHQRKCPFRQNTEKKMLEKKKNLVEHTDIEYRIRPN